MIEHKLIIPFNDLSNWNVQFLPNKLTIDAPVTDGILNVKLGLIKPYLWPCAVSTTGSSDQITTYFLLRSTTFHFNVNSKSLQIFLPDDIAFHWIDFIEIDYHSVTEDRDLKLGKLLID